ncbi:MAG: nucleotide-binding protein [Acidimicrobiia bacterium]|nr:nucleotide-binding protein [Acidimicrobiia bacterium]
MFDFLRAIGLQPIEWTQAVALTGKGSPYIGEGA